MRSMMVSFAAMLAAALGAPVASAAITTVGSTALDAPPGPGHACPQAAALCTTVLDGPGTAVTQPGVIVRWRTVSAVDDSLRLRVVRPAAGDYIAIATAPSAQPVAGGQLTSSTSRLSVAPGDLLAVEGDTVPDALDQAAPGTLAILASPFAPGSRRSADETLSGGLLLQADVEPDTDGDGAGDDSQDMCPADPERITSACAADLAVAATGAPEWAVIGDVVRAVFAVHAGGPSGAPDSALAVSVTSGATLLGVTTTRGTCTTAPARCALGSLAPGDLVTVTLTLTTEAPSPVSATITATSAAVDAVSANNAATTATTFTAPSIPPPPIVFAAPPCANLRIGSGDDELIDGTTFGDRLVGRGGRDLLRGAAGDDCLEGGEGADVLDGGAGADRLSGGAARDRLYGDGGDDRLTGDRGNDELSGGPGNDTVLPGAGADRVRSGAGNDSVSARDGTRDLIDCGAGQDAARVDRRDRVVGCESVVRG